MAVVVDSVTPADGTGNVSLNTPIVAALSDSTDMTLSLVEIVVDGTSYTVANGRLDYWSVKTESGGSMVDDLTSVTFATVFDWYTESAATITVVVKYDGSTLSTTDFEVMAQGYHVGEACPAIYNAYEISISPASNRGYYFVLNPGTDRCATHANYWVITIVDTNSGVHYYIGFPFRAGLPASTVVGEGIAHLVPASTVVQGQAGQAVPASVIVQGYFRSSTIASVITGVRFRADGQASVIVGVEVLAQLPASTVVYGVLNDSVVEIDVQDATTRAALVALGVTFE